MKKPKLQSTIITTITALDNRKMFQKDFVEMCIGANIALEKVSKMSNFLQKYCPSGGSLTTAKNLRDNCIPLVANEMREKIFGRIADCASRKFVFSLNVDETTDERERHVSNVILNFRDKTLLVDTEISNEAVNHRTMAKLLNRVIQNLKIQDCKLFYLTDNTGYMRKSFEEILSPMYPNLTWIGCWAHIIYYRSFG